MQPFASKCFPTADFSKLHISPVPLNIFKDCIHDEKTLMPQLKANENSLYFCISREQVEHQFLQKSALIF